METLLKKRDRKELTPMETCISRFKEGVIFDNSNIVNYSERNKPGYMEIGKIKGMQFVRNESEIILIYTNPKGDDEYRWTIYKQGIYAKIIK